MIVDAHLHIWNNLNGKMNNEVPVKPLGNGMIQIGDDQLLGTPAYLLDCCARAEYVVSEFDAAGVDLGVVVQDYMDGEQNDYLLEIQDRFPGRFFAHALPNFFKPDEVVSEAVSLFDAGFRGLKLCGEHFAGRVRLDDERFMPIWEQMEQERYVLAAELCEGDVQVPEFARILARYPKLHVAIGHFGYVNRRGWPAQLELCNYENVHIELGGVIWLYRHEGYPFPGAMERIRHAIEVVGIDKIMWGSDWPRTMIDFTYRQSIDYIRKSPSLDESEKAKILGENAIRVYRLSQGSKARLPVPVILEG
jgi:L-galactono-1,5-lactonase